MPWHPLPNILFAICTYPFHPSSPTDLPLQLGDELYLIEQGGKDGAWYRGYLVAPPSLLAGLSSSKGQPLEARVFSGIFPRVCVHVREVLGEVARYGKDGVLKTDNPDEGHLPTPQSATSQHRQPDSAVQGLDGMDFYLRATANGHRKPPAPVPMLKIGDETPTSLEEPLVDEIASCLREWHSTNLHELLLNRQYELLEEMMTLVSRLDIARRQLLHKLLTKAELELLRENAIWDLVNANRILGGEVVVRSLSEKGRILTYDDSAVEVSRLQSMMSLLEKQPAASEDIKPLYHLLVDLVSFVNETETPTVLGLSLHIQTPDGKTKLVSESYAVDASVNSTYSRGSKRTLFTDLTAFDADEVVHGTSRLLLVVKVVTNEPLKGNLGRLQQRPLTNDGLINQAASIPNSPLQSPNRRSFLWPSKASKDNDSFKSSPQRLATDVPTRLKTPDFLPSSAISNPSAAKDRRLLKRTSGFGVLDVTSCIKGVRFVEEEIKIWSPVPNDERYSEQEEKWDNIISQLAKVSAKRYRRSGTVSSLLVGLTSFVGLNSEALIKATPTLLQSVQITPRIGFVGAPTQSRSDIYLTLVEPSMPPNSLLSHPKTGSVPLPGDMAMSDLQLTLEVRNAAGNRIENCIYPASNSPGHTAWRTTAIERGDSWNQTIMLAIQPQDVPGSHVVMSLADANNFPFALGWMPLWTSEAFIRDGDHQLALYKYDETTSSMISGKGAYLALPWSSKAKDEPVFGPVAALHLSTYLCSTSYSQDPDLLTLLKWRDHRTTREIIILLKQFQFVPEIEVVKLLNEVFDALFEMLVEYSGKDEIEDLVFECVVVVLGVVHDRRFKLQPLVDDYTATRFQYPFAFPCLTRSFVRLLSNATDQDVSRRLRATCKVGNHVFKFIVKARQQQIIKEAGIGIKSHRPTFAKDLHNVFAALNALMRKTAPILVGTKTLIVQNFHTWLPEISDVINTEEMFDIASRFIDSCAEVQGKLVLYKLVAINMITSADLFKVREAQRAWSTNLVRWMEPHWGRTAKTSPQQWHEQIRLCSSICSTVVMKYNDSIPDWTQKIIGSYLALQEHSVVSRGETLSLLFPTSYPFQSKRTLQGQKYNEALLETFAILTGSIRNPKAFAHIPPHELASILTDLLHICTSILDCEAFPSSWLSLQIYHHKAILEILDVTSDLLIQNLLPVPDEAHGFKTDLWMKFFLTLLKVVGSEALALETFPEQKRRAVWKIAGDVREAGASILYRTWRAIGWEASAQEKHNYRLDRMGGYQVQYVPHLVGPILELCLSVHEGLRSVAIAVLQTMIISEWALCQDLAAVQAEMINSLAQLYKTRPSNDALMQKLFIKELLSLFESLPLSRKNPLFRAAKRLADVLDHLIDLLIAVHGTTAVGEASHIMDTLRLMEFLRDMQKEDIYIRYVHELADIQSTAGNPTEAGLALKMHSDMYDWDISSVVPAVQHPQLPEQTSFERKEQLHLQSIVFFEEGAAWELALDAYTEIAREYESNTFDYGKLAQVQRSMALIYENISKGERQSPRYFGVSFRGLGFPSTVRDKQFIFEGHPADRYAAFTDKMLQQYPTAQIVGKGTVDDLEGQYLTITPVGSQKNLLHPVNRRPKVSPHVREHFMYARPNQFTTTPKRRASQITLQDSAVEKIVYTTAETFPTILRRSEVTKTQTMRLSPIQIGLERTLRKTQELQNLETLASDGTDKALKPVTEALVILTHPESGGCVVEYWKLISSHEPVQRSDAGGRDEDATQARLGEALKVALIDHVLTIRRCLMLYTQSTQEPGSVDLKNAFEKTFSNILVTFDAPMQDHLSEEPETEWPSPPQTIPKHFSLIDKRSSNNGPATPTTQAGALERTPRAMILSPKTGSVSEESGEYTLRRPTGVAQNGSSSSPRNDTGHAVVGAGPESSTTTTEQLSSPRSPIAKSVTEKLSSLHL